MHASLPPLYHVTRIRPTAPFCLVRALVAASSARQFASTSRLCMPEEDESDEKEPSEVPESAAQVDLSQAQEAQSQFQDELESGADGGRNRISYRTWLAAVAGPWRLPNPDGGTNWLGSDLPEDDPRRGTVFPANLSFRPPTPLSNADRNAIFTEWIDRPGEVTVRGLSTKYGISIDRVNAVIKLKDYEANWPKKVNIVPHLPSLPSSRMNKRHSMYYETYPWSTTTFLHFLKRHSSLTAGHVLTCSPSPFANF